MSAVSNDVKPPERALTEPRFERLSGTHLAVDRDDAQIVATRPLLAQRPHPVPLPRQADAFGSPPGLDNRRLFYLPKLGLVLSMWAVRAAESCLRAVHGWSSPLLAEGPRRAQLQLLSAGLAAVYCSWLAYLLLRTSRTAHRLDVRSRVAFYLTGCTACVTLAGLATSELAPVQQSVPSLFSGLVLVNLYGVALACFYMPAHRSAPARWQVAAGSAAAAGAQKVTPFLKQVVVSDHSSSC